MRFRWSSAYPCLFAELVERGNVKAVIRLAKHFGSLSPAFKVFSTQISSHSIITNLTFGGARYVATGRGFAHHAALCDAYDLTYFWVSIMAMCVSPFLFNPHQFSEADFIIDYRYVL